LPSALTTPARHQRTTIHPTVDACRLAETPGPSPDRTDDRRQPHEDDRDGEHGDGDVVVGRI
jgi:hypothetical protein